MSLFDRKKSSGTTPEAFEEPVPLANSEARNQMEPGDVGGVIPLVEEQLVVGKRLVETGTVRLHKHTEEWTETVRTPLTQVRWQVEHVPLGRVVEVTPEIRTEGETTIYPVIEERLVVRRELVLVEEVRVTRAAVTVQHESAHRLKREQIAEERSGGGVEQGGAGEEHGWKGAGQEITPGTSSLAEKDAVSASAQKPEMPLSLDLQAQRRP